MYQQTTTCVHRSARLALVLLLAAVFSGCGGGGDDAGTPVSGGSADSGGGSSGSNAYSVTYMVTGTAGAASLTYTNSQGGTEQVSHVALPWSAQFSVPQGNFLYLSAQNEGDTGSVSVTVKVNGTDFKYSTSTGAYVIASASGSCC